MITCWRGDDGDVEPVVCECEVFGWPNKTADGKPMWKNSHFLTIEEAWESIDQSVKAQLSLSAAAVEEARARLAQAERRMVEAGMRAAAVNAARERK